MQCLLSFEIWALEETERARQEHRDRAPAFIGTLRQYKQLSEERDRQIADAIDRLADQGLYIEEHGQGHYSVIACAIRIDLTAEDILELDRLL